MSKWYVGGHFSGCIDAENRVDACSKLWLLVNVKELCVEFDVPVPAVECDVRGCTNQAINHMTLSRDSEDGSVSEVSFCKDHS